VDLKRDCVPQTLKYVDRDGETWAVKHNEAHKWKYLKGMTPEELVLIKWLVLRLGLIDLDCHTDNVFTAVTL
jgi:hypothetical protein